MFASELKNLNPCDHLLAKSDASEFSSSNKNITSWKPLHKLKLKISDSSYIILPQITYNTLSFPYFYKYH